MSQALWFRLALCGIALGSGVIAIVAALTAVSLLWLLDQWQAEEIDPEVERVYRLKYQPELESETHAHPEQSGDPAP